jgi:hypothetical protein
MSLEHTIAQRRPVWIALADLFLDTDVRISYPFIARTLAESPYSIEELRKILDDEVTPVVESNLLAVAGEWAAFDEEALVQTMAKRLGKSRQAPLLVNMDREWEAVSHLAGLLRALPAGDGVMSKRALVWGSLMVLIRNRRARINDLTALTEFSLAELESFFRHDLWPVLMEDARRLARLEPEIYPDELEIESNWRDFVTNSGRPL